jgi:DNA (cytosine-5)-methyltransferase 1
MTDHQKQKLSAIDFFCGAGGMTYGFRKAEVNVLAGIDIDSNCKETYELNNQPSKFIEADIKNLTETELAEKTGIKRNDDTLIFIGCSPCQYWSKINTDKTKSKESKSLLSDFRRFVDYFKPGYLVIENVPGILRRREESPLKEFLDFLDTEKYNYTHNVINASYYGVPQTRRRFLLIASRVTKEISLPIADTKINPPTVRQSIGDTSKFVPIPPGHKDKTDFLHTTSGLSINNQERLKITPHNGGTRKAWSNTKLQIPAYVGKDDAFQDVYGRMFWDRPAPTITTKFYSITNGRFGHPEQDRGISLREGATLQTFDSDYKFFSNSIAGVAKLIGNAVPPALSQRIAETILNSHKNGTIQSKS